MKHFSTYSKYLKEKFTVYEGECLNKQFGKYMIHLELNFCNYNNTQKNNLLLFCVALHMIYTFVIYDKFCLVKHIE